MCVWWWGGGYYTEHVFLCQYKRPPPPPLPPGLGKTAASSLITNPELGFPCTNIEAETVNILPSASGEPMFPPTCVTLENSGRALGVSEHAVPTGRGTSGWTNVLRAWGGGGTGPSRAGPAAAKADTLTRGSWELTISTSTHPPPPPSFNLCLKWGGHNNLVTSKSLERSVLFSSQYIGLLLGHRGQSSCSHWPTAQ